jgi:hypothetical protein
MKTQLILFISILFNLTTKAQIITPEMFVTPENTYANMTVGVYTPQLDDFIGGLIGAFYDLDEDGTLECVGLVEITGGFFGIALWGDDTSMNEKVGLSSGDIPNWAILFNDTVNYIEQPIQFTGYVTNGIVNLTSLDIYDNYGCTDSEACNYNNMALSEDGTCTYSNVYYNCDGTCVSDSNNDGICDIIFEGCTDSTYVEYSPIASIDNGSCETKWKEAYTQIQESSILIDLETGWNLIGYTNDYSLNVVAAFEEIVDDIIIVKNNNAEIYIPEWEFNGIGNLLPGQGYQIKLHNSNYSFTFNQDVIIGCMQDWADNYNPSAAIESDDCYHLGCIEEWADNFDSLATKSDESCYKMGCTYEWADNYNEFATDNDSSCYRYGCIDEWADNYDEYATLSDSTCYRYGCLDPLEENFDSLATHSDFSCVGVLTTSFAQPYNSGANMTVAFNVPEFSGFIGGQIAAFYDLDNNGTLECVGLETIQEGVFSMALWGNDHMTSQYDGLYSDEIPQWGILFEDEVILIEDLSQFTGYVTNGFVMISEVNMIHEHEVEDLAYGGIVFYVDETGQHGLVAATEDLVGFEWGCYGSSINGADDSAIGTGLQNTLDIVSGCSETPIAASEALALSINGYTDWYLPSKDELIEMYNIIGYGGDNGNVGNFQNSWYWSSSEYLNYFAWGVSFGDGYAAGGNKDGTYRVRVIRAF